MEKKRLDKKKIKNANQNFKKNFFETDDDNHLSGYEVFYIFMICNVIGYCVEMVFCYLKHGYWESRQSLIYGPFGLAYGIGGVLLSYLLFKDTKKAWWKVFIKSYIWGTVAEYICSLGEELVFGHVSWDYSKMPLNINGRVCALYSVFWGIMGLVYTRFGKLNLFNAQYEKDARPIEEGCGCPACRSYSRAYIRHLLKAKEMLGMRLCVLHNLYFYNHLMEQIREAIDEGRYSEFKKETLESLQGGQTS